MAVQRLYVFPTEVGWMALVVEGPLVRRLVIGHGSRAAALAALDFCCGAVEPDMDHPLIARLQDYSAGAVDDFLDVPVAYGEKSPFAAKVVRHCRRIPAGKTISYGELARRAGSTGAARAVGTVMSKNEIPIIIPCHRVLAAGGRIGGYSAPGGLGTKRRLLELEARASALHG
ncbi:MAG: MGMT family protein [Pirellulales bacterium]|nr:MGMT family protein [Pirellulales bacterium]